MLEYTVLVTTTSWRNARHGVMIILNLSPSPSLAVTLALFMLCMEISMDTGEISPCGQDTSDLTVWANLPFHPVETCLYVALAAAIWLSIIIPQTGESILHIAVVDVIHNTLDYYNFTCSSIDSC